MQNKLAFTLRLVFNLVFLLVVAYLVRWMYTFKYDEFVLEVCNKTYRPELYEEYVNSLFWHRCFKYTRWGLILLTGIWGLFILALLAFRRKGNRLYNALTKSLIDNYNGIKSLDVYVRISLLLLLAIQLIMFTYYVVYLPYHYDEAFTYTFFSGKGIISSISFYPAPNNHVFHNILSSIFLKLPVHVVTAIRLDNLLASVIATYYFFKLTNKVVLQRVAIIATVFFAFCYPFIHYSMQSRGYGLLVLFSVLSIYAVVSIAEGKSMKKYIALYILSSVLGFFTIPSFLYCFVVVNIFLFLHCIVRFNLKNLGIAVLSNVLIGGLTLLLYTPIIIRNTAKALTDHNGMTNSGLQYVRENYIPHLKEVLGFFTAYATNNLYWVIALIVGVALYLVKNKYFTRFYALFMICLLVSPVPIMFAHQTVPFTRTWIHLIVPLWVAFAMVVNLLLGWVTTRTKYSNKHVLGVVTLLVLVISSVVLHQRFRTEHKKVAVVDYVVEDYFKILRPKLPKISSYARSAEPGDLSYFIGENLNFEKVISNDEGKGLHWETVKANDTPKLDVVILDKRVASLPLHLENYTEVKNENDYFIVYLKKEIDDSE